jgi:hypothetical protein
MRYRNDATLRTFREGWIRPNRSVLKYGDPRPTARLCSVLTILVRLGYPGKFI